MKYKSPITSIRQLTIKIKPDEVLTRTTCATNFDGIKNKEAKFSLLRESRPGHSTQGWGQLKKVLSMSGKHNIP